MSRHIPHLPGAGVQAAVKRAEELGAIAPRKRVGTHMLHHSHVVNIRGESYRLKDKRQSGLLTSSRLLTSTAAETQTEG